MTRGGADGRGSAGRARGRADLGNGAGARAVGSLSMKESDMIDAANSPDPVPTDDDTAWPDPVSPERAEKDGDGEVERVIEEGTAVLGSPD